MKNVAVIGGGISSLSFVLGLYRNLNLNKNMSKKLQIDVYQKGCLGGRIKTYKCLDQTNKNINITNCQSIADVGANFIDYETEQQKTYLLSKLSQSMKQRLTPFKKNFLLFKNGQLLKTQGSKVKQRYFYKDGFDKMIQDFRKEIQIASEGNVAFAFQDVQSIKQQSNNKWIISTKNVNVINQQLVPKQYDYVVFGCQPSDTLKLLNQSAYFNNKIDSIAEALKQIQFTKQMSSVFEFDPSQQAQTIQQKHPFYSILFLDSQSQITFICSHQEKYPENKQKLIVVQMNEALTNQIKEIKNLYPNKDNQSIQNLIYQKIPQLIRVKYGIKKNMIALHYWNNSLLKIDSFDKLSHDPFAYFNQNNFDDTILFCGDFLNKKSRVTSSMKIGFKLGDLLSKRQYFLVKL